MSEFEDLASFNNLLTQILKNMSDIVGSIGTTKEGSQHGEKTVIAAIANSEGASMTTFNCGSPNGKTAREQKKLLDQFKLDLRAQGIPFMVVDFRDGTKGVVFRDKDLDKVKEITKDLNIRSEYTKSFNNKDRNREGR